LGKWRMVVKLGQYVASVILTLEFNLMPEKQLILLW